MFLYYKTMHLAFHVGYIPTTAMMWCYSNIRTLVLVVLIRVWSQNHVDLCVVSLIPMQTVSTMKGTFITCVTSRVDMTYRGGLSSCAFTCKTTFQLDMALMCCICVTVSDIYFPCQLVYFLIQCQQLMQSIMMPASHGIPCHSAHQVSWPTH